MADCELLDGCPFFNDRLKNRSGMTELFKRQYCRTDNSECARHMVFEALGREHVPPDLFPNAVEKARQIIGKS